jgi:hypothetical protein
MVCTFNVYINMFISSIFSSDTGGNQYGNQGGFGGNPQGNNFTSFLCTHSHRHVHFYHNTQRKWMK